MSYKDVWLFKKNIKLLFVDILETVNAYGAV